MHVVGSFLSKEFSFLKVTAYKCVSSELPEGVQCADQAYLDANDPQLRLIIPESSINYDKETEDAVEWTLNDSSYFIRLSSQS